MAGSPEYINDLAEAAVEATRAIEEGYAPQSSDEAWEEFDRTWELLIKQPTAHNLMRMSITAILVQTWETGLTPEQIAAEGTRLHIQKNAGYAGADNPDPWANFRMATLFGASPLAGALIRLGDKYIRTVNLRHDPNNEQVGEAITETLRDAIAYPLIARRLQAEEIEVAA